MHQSEEVGVEKDFEVDEGRVARSHVDDEDEDPEQVEDQLPAQVLLHDFGPVADEVAQFLELGVGPEENDVDQN